MSKFEQLCKKTIEQLEEANSFPPRAGTGNPGSVPSSTGFVGNAGGGVNKDGSTVPKRPGYDPETTNDPTNDPSKDDPNSPLASYQGVEQFLNSIGDSPATQAQTDAMKNWLQSQNGQRFTQWMLKTLQAGQGVL